MLHPQSLLRSKPSFKKFLVDDSYKFQPLPKPSGVWPYRLNLETIIKPLGDRMVFHMVGDTGGVRLPEFQHLVATEMTKQISHAVLPGQRPQFLFHLGDLVYKFGEAEGYYEQFFNPYRGYPNPIFAIAGNHDSDVNPESTEPYSSLDAFTKVFCDTHIRTISFAGDTGRKTMIQPNVYWTLQTPLANIMGLYGNVPKHGIITDEQKDWFISELREAAVHRAEKALIVCVHHAPYSADINHSSSLPMIQMLEASFQEAGVLPDIVFSGHVHNYQRFSKRYSNGTTVPYIVAGAGGYDELHAIAPPDDDLYDDSSSLFDNVWMESYCAGKHGFLKIAVEREMQGLTLTGEYYSIPHGMLTDSNVSAALSDRFTIQTGKQQ